VVLAIALAALILSLLSTNVQMILRRWFRTPRSILAPACVLAAMLCLSAASYGALTVTLALLVFGYTLSPAICIGAREPKGRANMYDLAAILLLWLPLEFGVGATLVPRDVQGHLHTDAYGVAVSLALILFLVYRRFDGMKYQRSRQFADAAVATAGFLWAAAVLIPIGMIVGFIGPAHTPNVAPLTLLVRIAVIFVATALPEEILFRSLIQNWLMRRQTVLSQRRP
jgi:hypothetical protein